RARIAAPEMPAARVEAPAPTEKPTAPTRENLQTAVKAARGTVLKHSIAMSTIELAGIENVKQWLGHKSLSSTGQYFQVTDDEAAQAVKRALNV
ncbi:MAG: hypothetical protein DMG32_26320, partial [Acidobacteria bacterium]